MEKRTYKVIAFLLLLLFLLPKALLLADIIPKKPANINYVYDHANILEPRDEEEIASIAKTIDEKTGAQIVVVTVNDMENMTIEEYALKLFRKWGIGDKEKNNGILILANKTNIVQGKPGRIRIEVGYGLEGAINDGKAGAILDKFAIPDFEAGEYSKGICETFMSVCAEVAREYDIDIENGELSSLNQYTATDEGLPLDIILAVIFFIIIFIMITKNRNRRPPRGPFSGPPSGGFYGGSFRGGGFGGFGGFSSGSSSGRSFGGGSSGGGGASR